MFRRGHVFKETYKVEEQLQGTKTAFKVSHLTLKTQFVVEMIQDLTGLEELEYEERLLRKKEFALKRERLTEVASIDHKNLARILDSFELEGRHFIVREWIEGYSLRELVEQSLKPLNQKTAEEFSHQLLDLLETLAERDEPFVLGTLCPDFIVVNPEGRLEVTDFGLGFHGKGKTEFEPFSCPELLGGTEIDQRADLYSLGAILYFCVTGAEVPPIWDRITCQDTIPSPLELEIQVDGRFWGTLESMLSLNVHARPQNVEEVRNLFQSGDFEDTPESSPATWYPEQSGLVLGDSYPFAPFTSADWILKMVQAAMVGRARRLDVVQTRDACNLDFRFAAPDVPSPQSLLEGLTSDRLLSSSLVTELVTGLRMIGEFRDFKVVLDDWKQSWTLKCKGGKMQSWAGDSFGRSGVHIEVAYEGRRPARAEQAADELVRLVRKTRLCSIPITVGRKPLEPGRGTEISELPKDHAELYLASASLPTEGGAYLNAEPAENSGEERAFTSFVPRGEKSVTSHVDVRCIVAPGEGVVEETFSLGYQFVRRQSRVLWYRRGVLCGEQFLEKKLPLQLDIHINGDHLPADNSGLNLEMPDWLKAGRLKPILELTRILPLTRLKLEEYWEENPSEVDPKDRFFVGALSAPLLLLFFGWTIGPGLALMKAVGLGGLMKATAAAGGVAGAVTARDHLQAVRKACLKSIDAFEKEEI